MRDDTSGRVNRSQPARPHAPLTARPSTDSADNATTEAPPADTGQGAGRQSVPSPSPSMGALLRALASS